MYLELGQSLLEVVSWLEEPKERYLVVVREGGLHIMRYALEYELNYHFSKFKFLFGYDSILPSILIYQVERRRRDTINNMIMKLGKLIPDLFNPETGPPKNNTLSKGGILARACEYVSEMRQSNQLLREKVAKAETKLLSENKELQNQIDALKQENELLRNELESNGILWKKNDNILTESNS